MLQNIKTAITNVANQIVQGITIIAGIVAAVFAALFFIERNEKDADDALLKDQKANAQINQDESQVSQNDKALDSEAQKRQDTENQINNENKENPSEGQMLDFFNSNDSSNSSSKS
jgi:uncharacterized protein YxeA